MIYFSIAWYTKWAYIPKKLSTRFEVFSVVIFGMVFALNIALNNFSLGYISIAVNLIIRSCLPLSTFLSQQALSVFNLYPRKAWRCNEITLMVLGVVCAAVFTMAQIMAAKDRGGSSEAGSQILGVV